jgi:hypothetical protein
MIARNHALVSAQSTTSTFHVDILPGLKNDSMHPSYRRPRDNEGAAVSRIP